MNKIILQAPNGARFKEENLTRVFSKNEVRELEESPIILELLEKGTLKLFKETLNLLEEGENTTEASEEDKTPEKETEVSEENTPEETPEDVKQVLECELELSEEEKKRVEFLKTFKQAELKLICEKIGYTFKPVVKNLYLINSIIIFERENGELDIQKG